MQEKHDELAKICAMLRRTLDGAACLRNAVFYLSRLSGTHRENTCNSPVKQYVITMIYRLSLTIAVYFPDASVYFVSWCLALVYRIIMTAVVIRNLSPKPRLIFIYIDRYT